MCDHDRQHFDRRALLRLAGLGLATAGLGLASGTAHAAGKGTSLTADVIGGATGRRMSRRGLDTAGKPR